MAICVEKHVRFCFAPFSCFYYVNDTVVENDQKKKRRQATNIDVNVVRTEVNHSFHALHREYQY